MPHVILPAYVEPLLQSQKHLENGMFLALVTLQPLFIAVVNMIDFYFY
jgi:hypothetical protein